MSFNIYWPSRNYSKQFQPTPTLFPNCFFLRFHFITVSCLRLMFKLTWYLDLQCRVCPKTKQMSEDCKQTNLNKTLYYTTIYLLGLSVCLFVSNKRKNDWTDRDGRKISILPGHTNLHVIFIKIHQFKQKNRQSFSQFVAWKSRI